jgi:hypothetical protein
LLSVAVLAGCGCALAACGGRAVARFERTPGAVRPEPVHRHDGACCPATGRAQGARSDLVFANPDVRRRAAVLGDGAERARRDDALGVRENRAMLAIDHWPEPARASLDRPRYGRFTPERSNTFVYYGSDRGRSGGGRSWSGGGVWWERPGRDWWTPRHGW